MRRIFVATLVLIPVLANAQASTSMEQPTQTAATLVAKANPPAPLAPAKSAAPAASSSIASATVELPVHVVIHQITPDADYMSDAMQQGGTIAYGFGSDVHSRATSPELIHVVQADLAPQQLAKGSDVTVHLTVNAHGVPENIQILKATDTVVAQKTIAAVSQYRFKPATRDYVAIPADVSVDVKIK